MKIICHRLPTVYHTLFILIICSSVLLASCKEAEQANNPASVDLQDINVGGELQKRLLKNFDRLEEEKYQPQNIFLSEEESGSWPGDTEGRTILGLVLDAKATKRTPKYLDEIIEKIPLHLNSKGYMGLIYDDFFSEQQLSGNGWLLRGLCEYYAWKGDEKVLSIIETIVDSLFVPIEGHYKNYPINEDDRRADEGNMSGNTQNVVNKWLTSSDIGCVFIGMDGLIHAYKYYREPKVKAVVEEMIARFLDMDPLKIKAQTHATLTGMRGLLRYDAIQKSNEHTASVEKLWTLYKQYGMTETYANYNWFKRYDTWTEPCAIVDSYMVATQLWQATQNPTYLEDAEQIYYNALVHAQRDNGGFGCDNCPHANDICLKVFDYEAHWCCTMRGAEGLASAAEYSVFYQNNIIYFTSYRNYDATITFGNKNSVLIKQESSYPFTNKASFTILNSTLTGEATLSFFKPSYMTEYQLYLNGQLLDNLKEKDGFISVSQNLNTNDTFILQYKLKSNVRRLFNKEIPSENQRVLQYGPLIMGHQCQVPVKINNNAEIIGCENGKYTISGESIELTPIYHLMDPIINTPEYRKQVIFELSTN